MQLVIVDEDENVVAVDFLGEHLVGMQAGAGRPASLLGSPTKQPLWTLQAPALSDAGLGRQACKAQETKTGRLHQPATACQTCFIRGPWEASAPHPPQERADSCSSAAAGSTGRSGDCDWHPSGENHSSATRSPSPFLLVLLICLIFLFFLVSTASYHGRRPTSRSSGSTSPVRPRGRCWLLPTPTSFCSRRAA
jgi:hypothetical protein